MSASYVILSTPTCTRCKAIKDILEAQGAVDKVSFIDMRSAAGIDIIDLVNQTGKPAFTGIVYATDTGQEVSLKDLLG